MIKTSTSQQTEKGILNKYVYRKTCFSVSNYFFHSGFEIDCLIDFIQFLKLNENINNLGKANLKIYF